jgi:pilus assembly protein CpaF
MHKRLSGNLNLSALELPPNSLRNTEISSIATEALDDMSVALNKEDRKR